MDLARLRPRPGGAGKKLIEAARLQARGDLTTDQQERQDADDLDEQLAAAGVILADEPADETPTVYLLPDQVEAWAFWQHCGTQWVHGFGGPTGLNYPGVEHLMGQLRIPPRRRPRLWAQVRALEQGALLGGQQRAAAERANRNRD